MLLSVAGRRLACRVTCSFSPVVIKPAPPLPTRTPTLAAATQPNSLLLVTHCLVTPTLHHHYPLLLSSSRSQGSQGGKSGIVNHKATAREPHHPPRPPPCDTNIARHVSTASPAAAATHYLCYLHAQHYLQLRKIFSKRRVPSDHQIDCLRVLRRGVLLFHPPATPQNPV